MNVKGNDISKDEFMNLYKDIKLRKINVKDLDLETLQKVMLLLKEELELMRKYSNERMKKIENSLYNIKMYEKEIELLKKNS